MHRKAERTASIEAARIASQNEQAQAKNDLDEAKAILDLAKAQQNNSEDHKVAKKTGMDSAEAIRLNRTTKGTSIGNGALKINSMNKHKRRSFKEYRGQGR
jgi:leucyl aminopeptidase (aminopeptidase T)